MDQKLLEALNNLSLSLIEISEALKSKSELSSATFKAIQGGDFINEIKEINNGVKQLQKDTKLILSNQETIINIAKSKKEEDLVENLGKDKKSQNNLKDGIGVILLIASAVLALGTAFKIIGDVDFLSVIALSISLPMLAIGFAKVHESLKKVGFDAKKDSVNFILAVTSIAAAITISSWILRLVIPISFTQSLTAILIAGMFAVISFGMDKIVKSVSTLKSEDIPKIFLLPLILPAVALSIAISSWSLRLVMPITFTQALTSILISAMFLVMSFGISKIINAFKDITPADALKASYMIPLVLIAISVAITSSSYVLSLTKDVSFPMMIKILAIGVTLSVLTLAFTPSIIFLTKSNVNPKDIITGSLSIVLIATAIMISSHILALGNYSKYPDISWTLGVGLSMLAIGASIVGIGLLMSGSGGLGYVALAAGAVAVVGIAGTVVAISYILAAGKYGIYPSLEWSTSVGLSLAAFGTSAILLGTFITGTLGLGAIAVTAGLGAVSMIAKSISEVSFILKGGSYVGGPSKEWAEGIGLAIGAFSPVYGMLMKNSILDIFGGGGVGPNDFSKAINTVSKGIVDAAYFFANNTAVFKGGPSREWAEGVGGAIGSFAPVFKALNEDAGWFTTGDDVINSMSKAIIVISKSMVDSAGIFYKNRSYFDFKIDPSYVKNLSISVMDFSKLIESISREQGKGVSLSGLFGTDPVNKTARGMIKISSAFDALSKSIRGFGQSLNNLNEVKLDMFRSLTGNLALLSAVDSNMFNSVIDTIERRSAVFAELLKSNSRSNDRPSVNLNPSGVGIRTVEKKYEQPKDSKGETELQKLDKIIGLLSNINREVTGLDEYLQSIGNKDLSNANG